ncbi:MAG: glycosyltransferase [Desulfarculus sp.]|nr:MAG: glycosyltransferase [Desulfarculus sp.]
MNNAPRTPDISYVIITYNDAGRLPMAIFSAALNSRRAGLGYEIWVVDNGSTDHTAQVLADFGQELGGCLKIISLARNYGTTYSRNQALAQAQGRVICVLDSDAELMDDGLAGVLALLRGLPQVGILAPRIIMPDGSTYPSVKMLPTLTDKLAKLPDIFLHRGSSNRDFYPDFPFAGLRCVDTAISCCWFFRRELLELVGPLDERIFYAPEDVDWCLRTWKAGRAVVYYPHLRVLHHTRQLSRRRPLSLLALSHFKGILYYLHKHGYWFSRRRLQQRHIRPLASRLDPLLAAWERGERAGQAAPAPPRESG